jgi:hypothetical protein
MGMYHSTYFAYGVRIPEGSDPDQMDDQLRGSGVGHLLAGSYDRDMWFLTTECSSVDLGSFESVFPESFTRAEREGWDAALRKAAERIGVTPMTEPAWFVVPDMS